LKGLLIRRYQHIRNAAPVASVPSSTSFKKRIKLGPLYQGVLQLSITTLSPSSADSGSRIRKTGDLRYCFAQNGGRQQSNGVKK
jgi:hypothetical protein